MKAVILAGGLGTRLSEETVDRPKPMIEIGGKPMLWHIMKLYSYHGINEFIICCGYKGYMIKEYFANYYLHTSDVTFSISENSMKAHSERAEPWKVTLIDTGEDSMTGGRLRRVRDYLTTDDETFCFTYGDGLSDVNIANLIKFHKDQGNLATLTAVQPPGRYGALAINGYAVNQFREKADGDQSWVNGGFFILEPEVINQIQGDSSSWETDVLPDLAKSGQLSAFKHTGFWHSMDTLRDHTNLEKIWNGGCAPWKLW
ncbi:MAG: glucose-1-phosphate cytidylyltransferase [Chloroflexota bacterium]|nr:glucose-1-phosphate cytidylyltransferase [Chloroflexota bacterium]